ncbi:hypothetical protein [Jannaschia marina]|uniref:hypothetical protein n=1 Tax=Jannaschia marina TaxID=2741674 RepID=UPI0015C84F70|nr:hypothetical protein [Jannaschia marina]
MTLNDFLSSRGISMAVFAKSVNTTTATVSRIADGIVTPRKGLMKRIYDATDGAVTPNDLVGLHCVQPCPKSGRLEGQAE